QLDTRYFRGLEGEYNYLLHFILQKQDAEPGDYICRVQPKAENFWQASRSVTCEADLEPGVYEILPKITALKDTSREPVEAVVQAKADVKPQKLRQVGLSFDIAHSKALKSATSPKAEEKEAEAEAAAATAPESKESAAASVKSERESVNSEAGGDKDDVSSLGGGDNEPKVWNAVCVIGLRVYSQDEEITIQLADPKNPQEASSLAVQ
ncbi:hypothetical protein B0T26DRAFT_647887, partial [Lasiosphaeria miniovina]